MSMREFIFFFFSIGSTADPQSLDFSFLSFIVDFCRLTVNFAIMSTMCVHTKLEKFLSLFLLGYLQ